MQNMSHNPDHFIYLTYWLDYQQNIVFIFSENRMYKQYLSNNETSRNLFIRTNKHFTLLENFLWS